MRSLNLYKYGLYLYFCFLVQPSIYAQKLYYSPNTIEISLSPLRTDAILGGSQINFPLGFQITGNLKIGETFNIQHDLGMISYSDGNPNLYLFSIRPYYRDQKIMTSLSYMYASFSIFKSHILDYNVEFYPNDILTLKSSFFYEIKNLDREESFFEMSFQMYFTDNIALRSGVEIKPGFDSFGFGAILGIECLLSTGSYKPLSIGFNIGGHYNLETTINLRYYFDSNLSLKEKHRTKGIFYNRFK